MEQEELFKEYLLDAEEHLEIIESTVLNLERELTADEINKLFRSFHTLKGNAAIIGFAEIRDLSHEVEGMIGEVRAGAFSITKDVADLILACVDTIKRIHSSITSHGEKPDHTGLVKLIKGVRERGKKKPQAAAPAASAPGIQAKTSMVVKTIENMAIFEVPTQFEGNFSQDVLALVSSMRGRGVLRFVFDFNATSGISKENAQSFLEAKMVIEQNGGQVAVCRMSALIQKVFTGNFGNTALKPVATLRDALKALNAI
ncbi:MAG: Hpt domain-containing protein [Nitrospinae bacterium]|nr:Hpt domain-containing protein [Nitrospinota bacterium]